MDIFDFIINLSFIVFPELYTVMDSENNEYVFLKSGEKINSLGIVKDKTQLEAFENHVHLFGKVKKNRRQAALAAARLIANNLIKELRLHFPNKKFHIFLDCDFSDHIIVRFHQHWDDEPPYYDCTEFSTIEEFTIGI